MQLVELICGIATDDETFAAARAYIEKLDKTVTVSEDFPAFIVNRILLPMINEAIYTLYEGVGTVDAIDTAMRLGANHPMGPLQLADLSASTPVFRSCRSCTRVWPIRNTGPAPCWSNMSRRAGSAARRSAASMITAAARRSRRDKTSQSQEIRGNAFTKASSAIYIIRIRESARSTSCFAGERPMTGQTQPMPNPWLRPVRLSSSSELDRLVVHPRKARAA